eukprot:g51254.t1
MSAVVALASSRLAKVWSSVRSVLMSTRVCASGPVDGGCNGASGNDAVDGQSCRRPIDLGGGVARVVDSVDFWDRRGGSAVSSDVVGAGAVVTFLCCSAVSGPAVSSPSTSGSGIRCRYQSGKLVKRSRGIVFIISGRSSLERCPLVCRIVAGPGDGQCCRVSMWWEQDVNEPILTFTSGFTRLCTIEAGVCRT